VVGQDASVTHSRRTVADLLERHGLAPSRALGQNFVVDANTVRRIARLAGVGPGDGVVEIGAGLGSLTLALVETGADVTAIEIDRYLLPVLREVVEGHGVRVVAGDAREVDWDAVLAGHDRWALVANLPYNVATPLVLDVLDDVPRIDRMLVMVQREVGERLAAAPGSKSYGATSVLAQLACEVRLLRRVPRTVFYPEPNVESALVLLRRKGPAPSSGLVALVHAGFAHRRKALAGSLALSPGTEREAGRELRHATRIALEDLGHPADARAERLPPEDWPRLATEIGAERLTGLRAR
jgi:16S rRNA (adenine1518-N6/adenine1519-N6)-dimethyltransferase